MTHRTYTIHWTQPCPVCKGSGWEDALGATKGFCPDCEGSGTQSGECDLLDALADLDALSIRPLQTPNWRR